METHDAIGRDPGPSAAEHTASAGAPGRSSIDRLEFQHQWIRQAEEEQVEATAALYEKAARQWIQPEGPDRPDEMDDEEREAISQQLKLRQKCQDIAALILVDGLEEETDT